MNPSQTVTPLYFLRQTDFYQRYWERESILFRGEAAGLPSDLLTWDDLEARVRSGPLTTRDLFLQFHGMNTTRNQYLLDENRADWDAIYRLYKGGGTIVANFVQQHSNRLLALTRELEAELDCVVNVNLYATPPGSQGFDIHVDKHDVFVIQLEGQKIWRFYGHPFRLPNRFLTQKDLPEAESEPEKEEILNPGDLLYIPRGEAHAALTPADNSSVHLTIGLQQILWNRVLIDMIGLAAFEDENLRKSIQVSKENDIEQKAREFLNSIKESGSAKQAIDSYFKRFPNTGEALPESMVPAPAFFADNDFQQRACQWNGESVVADTNEIQVEVPKRASVRFARRFEKTLNWMAETVGFQFGDAPLPESSDREMDMFYRYCFNTGVLLPGV